MAKYLLGPELIWLGIYGVSKIIAKSNVGPNYSADGFIDKSWFWVAILAFCTFALFLVPSIPKNWLFLRIWIVCFFMGHFILETLCEAYSKQGPGIGMAYLTGMIFIIITLIAGSILVKLFIRY